jgi:hypothetical protein
MIHLRSVAIRLRVSPGFHDWFHDTNSCLLSVARDQEVDITSQLNLGVRLLQAQSHVSVAFTLTLLLFF